MAQSTRVNSNFAAATAAAREAAEQGIDEACEHLLGAARALVPIEEGTLERSGAASREELVGAVSFDTPYAVRQHEDMTLQHDAGRQAKYLEQPTTTEAGALRELIAARIRRGLT